ncbi:hypothetical protein ASG24_12445 [Methylophilus sp. Leaf414]|nr:hypothetical protein ASG24_12445 [Methylophilus sp. Leaf414]
MHMHKACNLHSLLTIQQLLFTILKKYLVLGAWALTVCLLVALLNVLQSTFLHLHPAQIPATLQPTFKLVWSWGLLYPVQSSLHFYGVI